jgi:hypothetical protein
MIAAATAVPLWFAYAPEHWLHRAEFATTKVDEQAVRADVYIGHPTENQAEAIALVSIPTVGDYYLDFEEEKYREGSDREFIHLGRGIWTLKSMRTGRF